MNRMHSLIQRLPVRLRWLQFTSCLWICCGVQAASADVTFTEIRTDGGGVKTVVRMQVTAAPAPVPAFRERLAIRDFECVPGNAATHYLRAFPNSNFDGIMKGFQEKYGDKAGEWFVPGDQPLSALPLDRMREAAATWDGIVKNFIAPASRCRDCDWGLGVEGMYGAQLVELVLPEFSASREMARILALRARVAVADGDYPRALDHLRMLYRLAQHVSREPLLICALIGAAEESTANMTVLEFIGGQQAPNLYWALTELPEPLVDFRRAMQFEMSFGFRMFPALKDAESAQHTADEWRRILTNCFSDARAIAPMINDNYRLPPAPLVQLSMSGGMILAYPYAKQRLVAGGLSAEAVAAMPVAQVIAVDAEREYRRLTDAVESRMYQPLAYNRQHPSPQLLTKGGPETVVTHGLGYLLGSLLLPAVDPVYETSVRQVWQMRALRVIEATRLYAAETGRLPDRLTDITQVAVPLNPATDQPYLYHLEGKTAVLELPESDGFNGSWRFEITLAPR